MSFFKKLFGLGASNPSARDTGASCKTLPDAARLGRFDDVEHIIESHADIDARDNKKKTALHYAASSGDLKMARRLVAAGANKDARDWNDQTPLHCAVVAGQVEVMQYLVEIGADTRAMDEDRNTPLELAGAGVSSNTRMLGALLTACERKSRQPVACDGPNGELWVFGDTVDLSEQNTAMILMIVGSPTFQIPEESA